MYSIPTIHPAKLLRDPSMASVVVHDLTKLIRIQLEGPTLVPPNVVRGEPMRDSMIYPTKGDVHSWFTAHHRQPIAVDIESTYFDEIMCIGFWPLERYLDDEGIAVPWRVAGGAPYWTPHDELEVKTLVCGVLEDACWPKVGQNFLGFDAPLLNRTWHTRLCPWRPWEWGFELDTMVAQHCVMANMPQSLAYFASIWTDLGPYKLEVHERVGATKDDFAKFENVINYEDYRLRSYCVLDAFATSAAAAQLQHMMA